MTLLELFLSITGALTGSAVFQYFLTKSQKSDPGWNVMLQTAGVLFGILGVVALLSYFFLPDPEIRKLVSIGVFTVILVLFHRARLKLKKEQEQTIQ